MVTYLDVSHLVTEDDTPVDNPYSEKLMRLLVASLYASWDPGRPFVAMANVGVFISLNRPPVVPGVLVSVDTTVPPDLMSKEHSAYFTWLYGKSPDLVVEIVSNRKGGELSTKMKEYSHLGIKWYAIYDPRHYLQSESLTCYELTGERYSKLSGHHFPIGLGLTEWEGEFEGHQETWLRWVNEKESILLTPDEKAERLARKLRELGVDPDSLV